MSHLVLHFGSVPTNRPRHAVTETPEVAAALDEAARRWPGVARAQLIPLVLKEWAEGARVERSNEALRRLVGAMPGASGFYKRDEDWPE